MCTFTDTFSPPLFYSCSYRSYVFMSILFYLSVICKQLLEGTITEIRHYLKSEGLSSAIPVILIYPLAFIVCFYVLTSVNVILYLLLNDNRTYLLINRLSD